MGFLALSVIWLFIPLAAIIIALYFLKMRRIDTPVPSTLLWQQITADIQANRPWQFPRSNLLLFLQILALALIAMAAARPFMRAAGLIGQDLACIIDNSASMAATDISPTRLEYAKARAALLAEKLGRGDRMVVIAASSRTQAVTSLTSDKQLILAAIRGMEQTDLPSSMEDAINLAIANRRPERQLRIVIYSDGSWPDPQGLDIPKTPVNYFPVGRKASNLAITRMQAGVSGGQTSATVTVANTGAEQLSSALTIKSGGRILGAKDITLTSGKSETLTFALPEMVKGIVKAELDLRDALAADNRAAVNAGGASRQRVLIVGPGNIFLEQALAIQDNLDVVKATSSPTHKELQEFNLIIWDRTDAPHQPDCAEWFIASQSPNSPGVLGMHLPAAPILWRQGTEISRYVDLSVMRYAGYLKMIPKDWAVKLADAGTNTVIAAGEKNGRRKISFAWDFMQSDLPLRVGFPILVVNTTWWLLDTVATASSHRPGDLIRLEAISGDTPVEITLPNGRKILSKPEDKTFTQTKHAGIYSWRQGDRTGMYSVNIASADESSLRVRTSFKAGKTEVVASAEKPVTNREVYPAFILAALGVLCVEWMVFHRRI